MTVTPSAATEASATTVAQLKTALLSLGLRAEPNVLREVGAKRPLRVRSGSCGGLDLVLPGGVYVNCPVREPFALASPFRLVTRDGALAIVDDRCGESVIVEALSEPDYYARHASDGTPLSQIGQVCSDRLGVGITNRCVYWDSRSKRCKFCSIGLNVRTSHEKRDKDLHGIVEVVQAAYTDRVPSRHLLLGGGTPKGPDSGAVAIAEVARAVKARWPDRAIYAMITPPEDLAYIDLLHDSGVDELGMNVEVFSTEAAARFTPGKHRAIGLGGYVAALEHAIQVFGAIHTRSITVVGLEPMQDTLAGVGLLASFGVMPILTPFRPLVGTEMEHHPRPSPEWLWELTVAAAQVCEPLGVPLGPTCIPCQANTLNAPGHALYRYY